VYTHWRRATQIELHKELNRNIKLEFNKLFVAQLDLKRKEIEKVDEKRARIEEIINELRRLGQEPEEGEDVVIDTHADEDPELVLKVKDSEIKSEKYLSPEEQERAAKQKAEAEARAAAAGKDNLGTRGLIHMMNNTLESRREEDEIFIDIERPDFIELPADELTEEQRAALKDFEARVKKLEAEREKRGKGLQTELAKLRSEIAEICKGFNERLFGLSQSKMAYDQAIFESELLGIKWSQARLRREQAERMQASLTERLFVAKDNKVSTASRLADFKKEVDSVREVCEALAQDDKALERGVRRDLADAPEFVDVLLKLYRRRRLTIAKFSPANDPGDPRRGSVNINGLTGGLIGAGAPAESPKLNRRASQASKLLNAASGLESADAPTGGEENCGETNDPYAELDQPTLPSVIEPLDAAVDMPEGLSFDVWDRLVEARNTKIASEEELKRCSSQLAEMNQYLQMLVDEDEKMRLEVEELSAELKMRREAQLYDTWDIELPFKLKQGQIEVEEAAVVTDFGDAMLIHKSAVQKLNIEIKKLGGEKVDILKEIRDFRRGIVMLQWENERSEMQAVDLIEQTKEFQLLRVTKDLQHMIRGGSEQNQQVEVSQLERKLEAMRSTHDSKINDLKRQVAKINRLVSDKEVEMDSLRGQIDQLEGSVLEREMIHEVQLKNKDSSGDSYKRFEDCHMKRKLQTLVQMQTQEISLLREELDRLRRRTFPTFTHIEANRATDGAV